MSKTIALVGNQNCGKTTIFNTLTGSSQHVGNFPGVTVEKKQGTLVTSNDKYQIVDLPGIYSLTPYSEDESVAINYLLYNRPQLICNIIDASHLERSLYLTLQLMELHIPMLLIFNMMDEVSKQGIVIDIQGLEKELDIPIVPISATKRIGFDKLICSIDKMIQSTVSFSLHYDKDIMRIRNVIASLIEVQCINNKIPIDYCVSKLIEGDTSFLPLHRYQKEILQRQRYHLSKLSNQDVLTTFISSRYAIIDNLCFKYTHQKYSYQKDFSYQLDRLLTHRYLGIPIFFCIMLLIFYFSFLLIGPPLQHIFEQILYFFFKKILCFLEHCGTSELLLSLIEDGIFKGVGSVLSFLPVIIVLFFFLSLLEDSGYMARVTFLMDSLLQSIGLSGRSIVPLLIGFGCNVPAIMATRTLPSQKDRELTIMMIPLMPCSAKLPIYAMIVHTFFQTKIIAVMFFVYILSIGIAIIYAFILHRVAYNKQEYSSYILELPHYRLPTFQNTYRYIVEKAKDFINKVFTIILIMSIVIWFLQYFDFSFQLVSNSTQSILATIGQMILPFFAPLGFEHYEVTTALLTGICAKESVVSTLQILSPSALSFSQNLWKIFTPLSALSFLTFTVLYMPCMATFATIKKELHSVYQALLLIFLQTSCAYVVSFLIYQIGKFFI